MATTDLVPPDGSYEDRLAKIAADAAPPLDAITVERLRGLLGPALRARGEAAPIVPLPTVGEPHAPERAA
jgi:hypothetical protein